jgi:membrane associated rhomboid family serine protease
MGSYPNPTQPEILPPDSGTAPYQQPVRKQRSSWASAPATYVLVGINCAVFLAMLANHVSFMSPSPEDLMHWGANNAGAVLILGQWWRVVTAMFVHVGIIHLATNMWCLWNLGMLAESLIGTAGVFAAYILSGAAGNLLSVFASRLLAHPGDMNDAFFGSVGAGASGAVFGLAGLLIVLLKSPLLPVPPEELKRLRRSVIYFAGINLLIGLGTMVPGSFVRIDNMAHIGGCLCGLLFAVPLVPRIGAPRQLFLTRRRIAVGMVVLVLTLFAFFIDQFRF